jgi:protein-L-isoaspartate(D-aspartate) O-methyltransferase
MTLNVELARHNMIEQQVRPWDVLDERVLNTLSALRREDFVPAAHRNLAFSDIRIPLDHGEVMMKPVVEGRVLQAVAAQPDESVLEIGTGSGFLTACLARMAGEVLSIEQHADFVQAAHARLTDAGIVNVRLETAEAVRDFDPKRRFDVMVVTGAVAELPRHWQGWINPGGRLFAIVGTSPVQRACMYEQRDGAWLAQPLFETDLPYLRNAAPEPQFVL